jgi:hypothetical protein
VRAREYDLEMMILGVCLLQLYKKGEGREQEMPELLFRPEAFFSFFFCKNCLSQPHKSCQAGDSNEVHW